MISAVFATRRLAKWWLRLSVLAIAIMVSGASLAQQLQVGPQPGQPGMGQPGMGQPGMGPGAAGPRKAKENESERSRGLPIERIYVAGNRRITEREILLYLRERPGQPFSPEVLSQDVRELWRAGFFDDIEVDLEREAGGVVLRFLVRERPAIGSVVFTGNDEIDKDDLSEAIEVQAGAILSYPAIRRSVQKIRDMYAEQGYFLAEVETEVIPQKNNEVKVEFKIVEHDRVSVRRIVFIGNDNIDDDELRSVMFTGQGGFFSFGSGAPFRQDAFERDIAIISALYYDRGFLSVTVNTPRVMLTPDRTGIEVTITVEEGPRFKIRQLQVYERGPDGNPVKPLGGRRHLRQMIAADPGDYFNRAELLENLQAIKRYYQDAGYAYAEANPQTRLYPDQAEVDVTVAVERGPEVIFQRINIRGNTKTQDKVIRREFEISEGKRFSQTALEESRRRVAALGYFERVDVSTERGTEPGTIIVNFEVTERPTGTFQVGAGFSSIESFIVTAQVQQANLFGYGQSLSLQAQISGIRQMFNLRFTEPYFLDSKFSSSIDAFDQLRVYTDFTQQSRGGSLSFGYPLVEPHLRLSLTYTAEQDTVTTGGQSTFLGTSSRVSVFQRLPLANLFNDGFTSSLRPAITYDNRDNRLFPTSGIYLFASTEYAVDILGSQNQFVRDRFIGRFYYPIGGGIVAKLNVEVGYVASPSLEGVPIFARFFLGGILDLRGFRFRSVGSRLRLNETLDPNSRPIPDGAVIGGNLMYLQNLEVEFPLLEAVGVRGVFFTDAGNAWNLENLYCLAGGSATPTTQQSNNPCFDQAFPNLRTSWGFGVRWFSPLGPLRFEWGFPFAPYSYEDTSVFEFTIGNFF